MMPIMVLCSEVISSISRICKLPSMLYTIRTEHATPHELVTRSTWHSEHTMYLLPDRKKASVKG